MLKIKYLNSLFEPLLFSFGILFLLIKYNTTDLSLIFLIRIPNIHFTKFFNKCLIMRNNKLFSILIIFLFILSCNGDTLTFYEKHLTPQETVTYSDNSVVFRLVEKLNGTCNVPNLTYRILYPNGTISTVYRLVEKCKNFFLIF